MANDIYGATKEAINSGAVSKEVKSAAEKLGPYVGTNKSIPPKLKEEIKNLKSKSNIADTMKRYVKNK